MLSLLTGAAVNCLLILAGTLIGCLLNRKTLQKIGERIFEAFGLLVCAMGFAGSSKLDQIYLILASIIIGVALGEFFDLDGKFRRLAEKLQTLFSHSKDKPFAKGLIEATFIFCIGSMAIIGSLEAGINQNHTILITKGIIDGISACMMSMTLGIGVGFSALFVFIYQGTLTLGASLLQPLLSADIIAAVSTVGNLFLIGIGLNMLKVTKIKAANFLPAMFIPIMYALICHLFIK